MYSKYRLLKIKKIYFIIYVTRFDSFHKFKHLRFFIFAPRLDFGYASKPNRSASGACGEKKEQRLMCNN
jgi:hypothetical protein